MSRYYFSILFYALLLPLVLYDVGTGVHGNKLPGKSSTANVKCIERERQALLSFQQGLADANGMLSTWRDSQSNGDCCKWEGIQCNNQTGHVLKLDLHGWDYYHRLNGQINISSLTDLQNLEYLDLSMNGFSWFYSPGIVCSFTKLRYLNMSNSGLGGKIPYELGNMSQLQYLDLSVNLLVGAIPPQLGKLTQLRYLNLGSNYLEGRIPHQIINLEHLQYLDLGGENDLSGAIPFQIGSLPMLQTFKLSGEFDLKTKDTQWLSNLHSLKNLDLSLVHLDQSNSWLQMIRKRIPTLRELRLVDCGLLDSDMKYLFISHSNFSSSLRVIDLSDNMLTSDIFRLLSNYSNNLHELYLSNNNLVFFPPLYPNFLSLVILDLSYNNLTSSIFPHNDLSSATFQGDFMFNSKLEELNLQGCRLMDRSFTMSSYASIINSSSSLVNLDLSYNFLTSSTIFHWLFNFTTNLHILHLDDNLLEVSIPHDFAIVMNSLEILDLSNNKLQGPIPIFGNICTLHTLYLFNNNLSGDISSFIQNSSWCNRHIFHHLSLYGNRITGILPKSIGLLSELEYLDLGGNSLEGEITESHLTNLSKLKSLDLSHSSLSLKFAPGWVLPFQLEDLRLASCKLGPNFPSWLYSQSHLRYLDISNSGIHDFVPEWFWNNLQVIHTLDMSHNSFIGGIPNFSSKLFYEASMYLNSNQFEGAVPSFLRQASWLDLSENKFSDLFSLLCNNTMGSLSTLVLANNQIQGKLPDCWEQVKSLLFLDLSNNNLSGTIPRSMATLNVLHALVLRNNRLDGELPATLKNCTNLIMLDVSQNLFSGPIPSWMGESMQQLIILSMSRNRFSGNIPMNLCYLKRVQVLDLSRNNLSNKIPTCMKNFIEMSAKSINSTEIQNRMYRNDMSFIEFIQTYYINLRSGGFSIPELNITLVWKGVEYGFNDPEFLLKSIDLSSNHLTGEIPKEFGYLIGLVSLNLSRNNLSGEIPFEIGNLTLLEFLDLSRNNLSGKIPSSISEIDALGVLNLSYNSLSGRIPVGRHMQTYEASSF